MATLLDASTRGWFLAWAISLGTLAAGCGGSSSPPGNLCALTQSPNSCLRCMAQQCPTQLDHCFGDGFHTGKPVTTAACGDYSQCVQTCGCLDACFGTCSGKIQKTCEDCQATILNPCRTQFCSRECTASADGGA